MHRLQDEVWAVLRRNGVIARRDHPELLGAIDWLVRRDQLCRVLPGVYAPTERAEDFRVRAAAVARWSPDAVLTGASAARLTFWPAAPMDLVEVATARRGSYRGFRLVERVVPGELVVEQHGLRLAAPALAALDLSDTTTDAIDQVLRSRTATLDGLWRAFELTRGRRGNCRRLLHLIDSRDEPWSAAERLCHRLLRDAGITGWESNLPVRSGGRLYFLDVAFPGPGVVVEIDGRLHETDLDVFENDRWRQNDLVLDGWVVLRFTWAMLNHHPETVVEKIRAALAAAQAGRPLTYRGSICREADPHARRGRNAASTRRIPGKLVQRPSR
ncbi:MAG: endonuclease domain-containing protein [Janthinobacterium lividum]